VPSCRYRALCSPCGALDARLGFKALLSRRVRCDRSAVKRAEHPIPSWASFLSRACFTSAVGRASTTLPSRACLAPVRDVRFGAPQGLAGPKDRSSLARRSALCEVPGLFDSSCVRARRRPGLSFRLGRDAASPRHRAHLLGLLPFPAVAARAIVLGPPSRDSPAFRPAGIAPQINRLPDLPRSPTYTLTPGQPSPSMFFVRRS
jgi:hypothetical protein